ncbi:hypothetical protein WJX75_000315 [Coccomyxa subellipsoidea]|uniref:S-adenosyl-L-methionine-dependent methyltransferase n=1 Tax=Coccomyxa subellipsoidea TaxID=248742 RepID=A0ABR2Z2M6_9CHLO
MADRPAGEIHQTYKKRKSLPNDQEVTFTELEPTFEELDEVVKNFGTLPGWGGGDQARWSSISGFPEQVDFYARTATHPAIRTVCEVGFNAGYSTAVWLAANPLAKVISFDLIMLGHYGPSCAESLLKRFPGRLEMHWGDSAVLLPQFVANHTVAGVYQGPKCDLVHIDGNHGFDGVRSDFHNMYPMMSCDSNILMDDVFDDEESGPTKLWSELKAQGVVEEVDSFFTSSLKHLRTAGPNRGHNKGFVIGRLKCAETKPALAA